LTEERERRAWWIRGGALGALLRVLLFAVLFLALFQLKLILYVTVAEFPTSPDRVAEALLVQAVTMLLAALLAGWAMLRWVDRRPLAALGFALERRVPRDVGVGLAIGAVALAAAVLVLAGFGAFRFETSPGTVPGWVAAVVGALLFLALPAAAEEALFRGYAFRALVEGAGPVVATLSMSVLFTVVHGANPNVGVGGLFNIFAASIMLSLAVLWTGSLWFASALHLGWNWSMAGLLALPVSGLDLFEPPLYRGVAVGPDLVTGGDFGPEGGLAGTLAVLLAVTLTWWYVRREPGPAAAQREEMGNER
jgi:uncharacterized protein